MVGPGALKPKVGDGIKSRRPFSAPVLHSFILLFFFFVLCLLLHLYWCVYNNNNVCGAPLVVSRRVIKHCLCMSREICTVPSLYRPSTDGLIIIKVYSRSPCRRK